MFEIILKKLKLAERILIISHQKPDGDACGASLALFHFLKDLGKTATVFMADQPPAYFDFLPQIDNITSQREILKEKWDLAVVLDSGDWTHTKVDPIELNGSLIINIDHHFSNHNFGDINCVDSLASSTCEIIYKFLIVVQAEISKNIATCLLCGILNDTGVFSNAATTVDSMKIASNLLSQSLKIHQINDQVIKNKTLNGLRLWGDVLSRLQIDDNSKIALTYVKETEYDQYQIKEAELDGLINFLNVITEVSLTAFFRINSHETKVSLRTPQEAIDVSKIAKFYGGGGHKKAAGFTLPYALDERNCDFFSYLKNKNI